MSSGSIRRSRRTSGAALEAAYREAAADDAFRGEMNEITADFDITLADEFLDRDAIRSACQSAP